MSGLVTYEGEPIANATVTFKHETDGFLSVGSTDSDGRFTLASRGSQKQTGAKIGQNEVMIAAVEFVGGVENSGLGSLAIGTAGAPKVKQRLPPRYGSFETSGLTFTVTASGSREANFSLGD